ncbi:hypothetical protein F3Y22_tig00018853pilonHSYRG00001 [Hibiscus syriacus]|uniref:Uncharacterized protein n=1 Tax=Hibiscus syriacus TaxID=106335 RepID=A0A6A3BV19_HIBSY|nr:hypothetical protein F3Y22_tig00018853pilonHSYRG00001 [Hibiscus syriacus]
MSRNLAAILGGAAGAVALVVIVGLLYGSAYFTNGVFREDPRLDLRIHLFKEDILGFSCPRGKLDVLS